jgi:hypothetical protein
MTKIKSSVPLFAVALFLICVAVSPVQAAICGPGPNWVQTCPAGFDVFDSRALHTVDLFGVGIFTFTVSGPVTVQRGTPVFSAGAWNIPTELVSMSLTGGGLTMVAGDGVPGLSNSGPRYSPGQITDIGGGLANSFFDVFIEISGPPLGTQILHNTTQCHMTVTISFVIPYGSTYLCNNAPVLLFNQAGQPVGQILAATHTPIPEPAPTWLLGSGFVGLFWLRRSRRTS